MRRYVTFVILGLGVFAVVAGLLLRLWAYPSLAKIPHDVDQLSVAHGDGITALVYVPNGDTATPEIRENLSLISTTKVTGNLRAEEVVEDGDVTVWVEAAEVRTDDADGLVVNASLRSLCLDRYTGEAVAPCENQFYEDAEGERVVGERNEVLQPGLNFKFPFDTEKRDYQWFDTTLKKTVPANYVGEEEVKGLPVYKFVQTIPPTMVNELDVPGSLVGQPDVPTVHAELYYEAVRTLYVEPTTGAVVNGSEDGKQELRADGRSTAVFDGKLAMTDETVSGYVADAEDNVSRLWLMTGLPVILWIVGGVLIVVSIAMLALGRRGKHSRPAGAPTKVAEPV
ncbi:PorA family protein [Actinophytocola sp. KF-1]